MIRRTSVSGTPTPAAISDELPMLDGKPYIALKPSDAIVITSGGVQIEGEVLFQYWDSRANIWKNIR